MIKWLRLRRKKKIKYNNRPVGYITDIKSDDGGLMITGYITDPEVEKLLRAPMPTNSICWLNEYDGSNDGVESWSKKLLVSSAPHTSVAYLKQYTCFRDDKPLIYPETKPELFETFVDFDTNLAHYHVIVKNVWYEVVSSCRTLNLNNLYTIIENYNQTYNQWYASLTYTARVRIMGDNWTHNYIRECYE